MVLALILATATFTINQVGRFWNVPSWMPRSVAEGYRWGSDTNVEHRLTTDAMASALGTADAYAQRMYYPGSVGNSEIVAGYLEAIEGCPEPPRKATSRRLVQYHPVPCEIVKTWNQVNGTASRWLGWSSTLLGDTAMPTAGWGTMEELPLDYENWESCGSLLDRCEADGIYLEETNVDTVRRCAVDMAEGFYGDKFPAIDIEELERQIATQRVTIATCETNMEYRLSLISKRAVAQAQYEESVTNYNEAVFVPRSRAFENLMSELGISGTIHVGDEIYTGSSTDASRRWSTLFCLNRGVYYGGTVRYEDNSVFAVFSGKNPDNIVRNVSTNEFKWLNSEMNNFVSGNYEITESEQAEIDRCKALMLEKYAELNKYPSKEQVEQDYEDAVEEYEDAVAVLNDLMAKLPIKPFSYTIPELLGSSYLAQTYSDITNDTRRLVTEPYACANQLLATMDRTYHAYPLDSRLGSAAEWVEETYYTEKHADGTMEATLERSGNTGFKISSIGSITWGDAVTYTNMTNGVVHVPPVTGRVVAHRVKVNALASGWVGDSDSWSIPEQVETDMAGAAAQTMTITPTGCSFYSGYGNYARATLTVTGTAGYSKSYTLDEPITALETGKVRARASASRYCAWDHTTYAPNGLTNDSWQVPSHEFRARIDDFDCRALQGVSEDYKRSDLSLVTNRWYRFAEYKGRSSSDPWARLADDIYTDVYMYISARCETRIGYSFANLSRATSVSDGELTTVESRIKPSKGVVLPEVTLGETVSGYWNGSSLKCEYEGLNPTLVTVTNQVQVGTTDGYYMTAGSLTCYLSLDLSSAWMQGGPYDWKMEPVDGCSDGQIYWGAVGTWAGDYLTGNIAKDPWLWGGVDWNINGEDASSSENYWTYTYNVPIYSNVVSVVTNETRLTSHSLASYRIDFNAEALTNLMDRTTTATWIGAAEGLAEIDWRWPTVHRYDD